MVNFLQKLSPSQIKEWLGFVISSRSMMISLPQRKIDNLIRKAQDLKNKVRVSLREISQFLGLCNSSKPAVLQAPLHYLSFKRLLIRNLKWFPNPYQSDYLTVVTLDTPSIRDLDWWIQEIKYNCSTKNLYPPAKRSHSYRFERFPSKSGQNSRPMERKSVRLAHQYKGTNGSISCSAAVNFQLPEQSHTAVFRQYNSCCLLNSSGRGTAKSVQLSALATLMWYWCLERNIRLSAVHIPGLKNLFADPPSHLKIF